jgi:hypothetical protein
MLRFWVNGKIMIVSDRLKFQTHELLYKQKYRVKKNSHKTV